MDQPVEQPDAEVAVPPQQQQGGFQPNGLNAARQQFFPGTQPQISNNPSTFFGGQNFQPIININVTTSPAQTTPPHPYTQEPSNSSSSGGNTLTLPSLAPHIGRMSPPRQDIYGGNGMFSDDFSLPTSGLGLLSDGLLLDSEYQKFLESRRS